MKRLRALVPDGRDVLKSFAVGEARDTGVAAAELYGTQTDEGGSGPATGKAVVSVYACVMIFKGGKINHTIKIWSDVHALRGLACAKCADAVWNCDAFTNWLLADVHCTRAVSNEPSFGMVSAKPN